MQKALIYCRVSTEEQAEKGYSLDAQEKFCRNFAGNNAYKVVTAYRDEAKSATSLDRPALQDLLAKCQEDKSINAVIVQETDRLARNTKDHLTIKAILKKAEVKLISVAQPMLDDSPEGMMIDTIIASVNQFQSDINSRKTKKGLQEKFEEGGWPGLAPLGYLNVSIGENDKNAKKIIKRNPNKWDFLREGFKLYISGDYSVVRINDILYEKGLRSRTGVKVPESRMFEILKNPFYAGVMRWGNQEKKGTHEPMITLNEHKRILQIIDAHNMHACRRRKYTFLLRGFVICNICGHRYTAQKRIEKNKEYYHCASKKHNHKGEFVEVHILEKQIEEKFKQIQLSKEFVEQLMQKLQQVYSERKEKNNSQKQIFYNQTKAIELKRDKAEEKLLGGVLADNDFVRLKTKFKKELEMIENQIDELDNKKEYDFDIIHEIFRFAHDSYKVYKTAPYELKRQYLGLFWDRFLVQDKKIIEAVPTELIKTLVQEKKVLIRHTRGPSSRFIKTIENQEYMAELRAC